jgi:hypothetical protein
MVVAMGIDAGCAGENTALVTSPARPASAMTHSLASVGGPPPEMMNGVAGEDVPTPVSLGWLTLCEAG